MSDPISDVSSSLWSKPKKNEGSETTSTEPSTSEPTASEPSTSEPSPSEPTTEPGAAEPMPASQSSPAPAAKTYSSSPDANKVSPMSDRLRDLIVEHARRDAPVSTSLHMLVLRTAVHETAFAPEQVQRTRAEIISAASASLVAQANHTGDSVRALLSMPAAA